MGTTLGAPHNKKFTDLRVQPSLEWLGCLLRGRLGEYKMVTQRGLNKG